MIYIYSKEVQNIDWESAYRQLQQRFLSLSHSYQQALLGEAQLRSRLQEVNSENIRLKNCKMANSPSQNHQSEHSSFDPQLPEAVEEKTIRTAKKRQPRIKKQHSTEIDSVAQASIYQCTYHDCGRVYSSPVSLNLHIKTKHNGGTKKEREAYAKMIIEAMERGEPVPEVDLNFPPNFLQEFKITYEYMKKYNM